MSKCEKEWLRILSFVLALAGSALLVYATNLKLALALFLIIWAINIEKILSDDTENE